MLIVLKKRFNMETWDISYKYTSLETSIYQMFPVFVLGVQFHLVAYAKSIDKDLHKWCPYFIDLGIAVSHKWKQKIKLNFLKEP